MFLASDLSHERWDSRLLILAPGESDDDWEAVLDVESAAREDDKLLLCYTPQPNAPELTEKVIEVERSYASAPWDLLLPRLVDLSNARLYAFSSYDNSRRGLVLRTFRVVGPKNVQIDGRVVSAFKLEDSEGLIPPVHEIYVDKTGRILRVVLRGQDSPMEMVATTRQYIDRTYADRVKEAETLIRKYATREPAPPRRDESRSGGEPSSPDER